MEPQEWLNAWVPAREDELLATLRGAGILAKRVTLSLRAGVYRPGARYTAVAAIVLSGVPEAQRRAARTCVTRGEWSGYEVVFA